MTAGEKTEIVAHRTSRDPEPERPLTFDIVTLGCKVNQYESESIARELESLGFTRRAHRQAESGAGLDLCIINTCTVTRKAAMQSRQAVRQVIRSHPEAEIMVTGCLSQTAPEEIQKIEGVAYIVGHADKFRIPEIVTAIKARRTSAPHLIHRSLKELRCFQDMRLPALGGRTRPFLKIQDGCDAFCTYCIVPYARGRSRSMPMEHVLEHVRRIREAGYREIVLTGIHLGRYGMDLDPEISLFSLLQHLHQSQAIDRVRLSSLEPFELTSSLIDLVARADRRPGRICPHFHIPLQSGDDHILEKMHRPYRRQDFLKLVHRIATTLPRAAIGADVLIGFPGETDAAFLNTFHLLEELPLTYLHVFPFSPRRGTPAAAFPHRVPAPVIKERCRRTRELGIQKRKTFMEQWVGQTMEVLVEEAKDAHTGLLKGVSANYLKILMPGDDALQNTFQKVRIEGLNDERTLMGRTLS